MQTGNGNANASRSALALDPCFVYSGLADISVASPGYNKGPWFRVHTFSSLLDAYSIAPVRILHDIKNSLQQCNWEKVEVGKKEQTKTRILFMLKVQV